MHRSTVALIRRILETLVSGVEPAFDLGGSRKQAWSDWDALGEDWRAVGVDLMVAMERQRPDVTAKRSQLTPGQHPEDPHGRVPAQAQKR